MAKAGAAAPRKGFTSTISRGQCSGTTRDGAHQEIAIDGSAVNGSPIIDPVGAVVCAADVSNVKTVFVDGEPLKDHDVASSSLAATSKLFALPVV